MNRKQVIEILKMENELICFNPLTGEEIPLEVVNDLNRKCYDAHCRAITFIQNSIPKEWIEKWANKFFKIIHGRRFYTGDGYDSVWDMLDDWDEENGNIKESD